MWLDIEPPVHNNLDITKLSDAIAVEAKTESDDKDIID